MEAREFYDEKINEDSTIGSIELMEEYAKHIIELNFCDGSSTDFNSASVLELKNMHTNINTLVDWVNSEHKQCK